MRAPQSLSPLAPRCIRIVAALGNGGLEGVAASACKTRHKFDDKLPKASAPARQIALSKAAQQNKRNPATQGLRHFHHLHNAYGIRFCHRDRQDCIGAQLRLSTHWWMPTCEAHRSMCFDESLRVAPLVLRPVQLVDLNMLSEFRHVSTIAAGLATSPAEAATMSSSRSSRSSGARCADGRREHYCSSKLNKT